MASLPEEAARNCNWAAALRELWVFAHPCQHVRVLRPSPARHDNPDKVFVGRTPTCREGHGRLPIHSARKGSARR
eukprot:8096822-Alexandrium_andersonii.AAC.1